MKKLLFITLSLFSLNSIGQTKAKSCGGGCDFFKVEVRRTNSCNSTDDLSFQVTNNFGRLSDIRLFVQKKDGNWYSLGDINQVRPGEKTSSDLYWSCNDTGRYILYYKESNSKEMFPSENEVRNAVRN